ncbi:hypothetical protein OTK51_09665 [Vibrio scophthalmi]|uniref:hypothetical protein n=1 Tax=Vibrio scophthalmi TaxID=45658 RepID=UPI0022843DEE|nr:hypothetical protein [Vibrio scophthalmi]MCY9803705.1 hypothetical protein [Vibrio scophthalmi]
MKKIMLFLLLLSLPIGWALAKETLHKSAINALVTPTLLLGQGRYAQAADSFHTQSTVVLTLERQLGTKGMWQVAGLAEGLAAIAAEKNNDPVAYEYWSNSVRYFLMSGENWSQLQSQLHQDFEQSTTRLQVNMAPGDTGATIDNTWLQLFSLIEVWQEKLDYFSYRSPSSGLAQQVTQQSKKSALNENSSNGSQLRQYSPNKQLQLNDAFKGKQGFQPDVRTKSEESKPIRVPTKHVVPTATDSLSNDSSLKLNERQPKFEQAPATIVTPIVVEGEITETDHLGRSHESVAQESRQLDQQSEDKLISRGNLGTKSGKGVEASQRRSFTPSTE